MEPNRVILVVTLQYYSYYLYHNYRHGDHFHYCCTPHYLFACKDSNLYLQLNLESYLTKRLRKMKVDNYVH